MEVWSVGGGLVDVSGSVQSQSQKTQQLHFARAFDACDESTHTRLQRSSRFEVWLCAHLQQEMVKLMDNFRAELEQVRRVYCSSFLHAGLNPSIGA